MLFRLVLTKKCEQSSAEIGPCFFFFSFLKTRTLEPLSEPPTDRQQTNQAANIIIIISQKGENENLACVYRAMRSLALGHSELKQRAQRIFYPSNQTMRNFKYEIN